jgi:hypothetical protein
MPWIIGCKDCDLIFRIGKAHLIEIGESRRGIILRCPHCGSVAQYAAADIVRAMSANNTTLHQLDQPQFQDTAQRLLINPPV